MGSSDYEEIDTLDLAPLNSCHITPIETVPAEDKDKAKDSSLPGLETDGSSSNEAQAEQSRSYTYVESKDEEVEQWLDGPGFETDGAWPPLVEDEEGPEQDHSIWDPPSKLWEREYQFPNS